jgi:hypothetical protein
MTTNFEEQSQNSNDLNDIKELIHNLIQEEAAQLIKASPHLLMYHGGALGALAKISKAIWEIK